MRILILGATGSVGVHTSLYLKAQGYDVIACGRRENDNGFFGDFGIPYYSIDVKDVQSFSSINQRIDTVVHLAGAMPARMKGYNPYEYIESIIKGTLNVLEFMRERKIPRIVFSHSISDILYRFGSSEPIDDDVERRFPLNSDHSVYSISKNASVDLIEHYAVKYGIKRFVLRLPTIYVYHPNPFYYLDGVKKWMGYRYIIDQAIKGNTLEVWGNPNSIKEMVYVKDFAQMVKCCIDADDDGGLFNVGCGFPISIEKQIILISEIFSSGKQSSIVYRPEKPSSPQFVLSIEKAIKRLHYKPEFDFLKMMNDFKDEMNKEPYAKLWGRKEDYLF